MSEEKKTVLIVDDEPNVRESLRLLLARNYGVEVAESGDQALEILDLAKREARDSGETCIPHLVLLDVMMPGLDGLGLLERLRADFPTLPVIMLSASKALKTAVQAMKFGAIDYLNKPFDVDELLSLIEETLASGGTGKASPSNLTFSEPNRSNLPSVPGDFGRLVGQHPNMQELYRKIDTVAERNTTILVTGESGTGKELVAREIHLRSKRAHGPFVAINCAAIPESLIESELFGHEKGAFTHAVEKRLGFCEMADKGTLFLDEIGELSLAVQVKLLRFLQEHEFYRVGRSKPIHVDVRIVTATNKSLERAVGDGRFRNDLFYRINVVNLEIPPLRERNEDLPALVCFFAKRMAPLYGDRHVTFCEAAIAEMQTYSWPGNVRELENVTESIIALTSADEIRCCDLPVRIRAESSTGSTTASGEEAIPFEEAGKAFEAELILKALRRANYVQTKAAEILGISRRILKYKMDKLGISDRNPDGDSPSSEPH